MMEIAQIPIRITIRSQEHRSMKDTCLLCWLRKTQSIPVIINIIVVL